MIKVLVGIELQRHGHTWLYFIISIYCILIIIVNYLIVTIKEQDIGGEWTWGTGL